MLNIAEDHLRSNQVSRVVYGAIVGLAVIVALEPHPPRPAAMAATLVGTAVAVGLAELYSQVVGARVRTRRGMDRSRIRALAADVAAVAFGISFPAVFFLLASAGAIEGATAFGLAKWSGLGLIGFYGFCAARLSGAATIAALVEGAGVAVIGGFLIALKALVH